MQSQYSINNGVVSSNSSFFLGGDDEFDSDSSNSSTTANAAAIDDHHRRRRLYYYNSLLVQERQEMVNRRSLCLNRLREVSVEVASLRNENSYLRSINVELRKQFRLLLQSALQNRLGFGNGVWNRDEEEGDDRDVYSRLPKSISVKSEDYLKVSAPAVIKNGGRSSRDSSSRSRNCSTATLQNLVKQKVYIEGGNKKKESHNHNHNHNHGDVNGNENPIEVDVYKQGALKTEICNKWQETGECPYGDNCQFAHGVDELRPVMRHPRYKTQVCRMVLNGAVCPYGHRCHFLHALPPRHHSNKVK